MVSQQRLRKKLRVLGVLQEDINHCESNADLDKLKAKFLKENEKNAKKDK